MNKLKFSGHETFICKELWPKKGYDFITKGNKFNDSDSIIKLGVGKNMVSSIKYWMKALGLMNENDGLSEIAKLIFDDNGKDPYVEDIGTIWLLHYLLVTTEYASIYQIVFNEFALFKNEFTKQSLLNYIKGLHSSLNINSFNSKTIEKDINVFLRNYIQPSKDAKTISYEDEYVGLLQGLELIKRRNRINLNNKSDEFYLLERTEKDDLPKEIFLFAILNLLNGNIITLNEMISGRNSVGNIFLMNREGIYNKIENLANSFRFINFTQTAGLPTLQITENIKPLDILKRYYEHNNIYTFG